MRVEIGGGTKKRDGYRNFDPMEQGEWGGRLGYDRIPVDDGVVTHAYASHVMEHIPAGQPRIDALNEVWRILKPGGEFEIIVPCIGYTDHAEVLHVPSRESGSGSPIHAGWQAWADQTHVSYWWYPESFWYLTGRFAANASYGQELWEEVSSELRDGWEARVVLRKPV